MCSIPGTLLEVIISYWDLDTIVIQKITSRQIFLSVIIKRRSSKKRRYVKPVIEDEMAVAREANARMNAEIGSITSTYIM